MQRLAVGARWGILVGGFVAGWLSVFVASLATALELALSGTSPANIAIPAMGGIHALIGIGEGLITAGALAFLLAARPDLLRQGRRDPAASSWIAGLVIALGAGDRIAAGLGSPGWPGVGRQQKGFLDAAQVPIYRIFPDYLFPGVSNQAWRPSWRGSSAR